MSDIGNLIAIIAGFVTIAGGLYGFYVWVNRKRVVNIHRDFKQPVSNDKLSFEDIRRGIDKLVQKLTESNSKPEYIIGINRGGAIVGGMIAKKLRKDIYHINVEIDSSTLDPKVSNPDLDIDSTGLIKILLVDDLYHTGSHMKAATNYLKTKFPGAKIERLVMLYIVAPRSSGSGSRVEPIEHYAYFTYNTKTDLPWNADQD